MKKIFTLLVALFSLTAVFAQQGYRNDNSSDHRNSSTVYNSHQSSYGNYGDQKNWNQNDHRNDQSYGRNDQRHDYDQRRTDVYDRDRRIGYNDRVVYSNVHTGTNLTTVAGALIVGGILGALLSH